MEKDPDKGRSQDNYPGRKRPGGGGGRSGGGGILTALIPMLLKNPKLLLIAAIGFGIYYFVGGGCNPDQGGGGGGIDVSNVVDMFSTGFEQNPQQYDATDIYEPLADNVKNPLPEKVSLKKYAPQRLNQGRQGSCVAWASSYAARTILESRASGIDPNQVKFSPSYLYNQIALTNCQGSYLPEAMKAMKQNGNIKYNEFEYDETSCSRKPTQGDVQKGRQYTINEYTRLSKGDNIKEIDMLAIKQHLAQGAPVVIGMMVGGTFMQAMQGQDSWIPSSSDYDARGFGGHAMCVIGYDDYKEGGSFEIMNSWGTEWGNNGIAHVRYKDFDYFVKEAYGIFPMGNADEPKTSELNASIALSLNSGGTVGLTEVQSGIFQNTTKLSKGDKFKVEVSNSIPCYIYVFGQETDGSSYVLFPYTEKHSPYCGITGTRLFPADYSMVLDDIGNRDYIAVVISKDPLDYNDLNNRFNNAGGDYAQKLQAVVGAGNGVNFQTGNSINLNVDLNRRNAFGLVVAIDKN